MKTRSALSEAWRNVATRTSRPLLSLVVFVCLIGGLALYDTVAIVGILADARAFERSGATVTTVLAPAGVDGAACSNLSRASGVRAAGAVAEAPDLVLSALPSTGVPVKTVTASFLDLLEHRADRSTPGLYLSEELATALGAHVGDALNTHAGDTVVEGIYRYPDDGRAPGLGYAALIVAPPESVAPFDECWMDVPHPDDHTSSLIWTAVTANDPDNSPVLAQLNPSLGRTFDAAARFRDRASAIGSTAALALGAALGAVTIRLRRVELAAALHSRVPRSAVLLQGFTEAILWLAPASAVAFTACLMAAQPGLPGDLSSVLLSAVRVIAAGAAGVILGSATATWFTREKHLFRYFKER